MSNSATNAIAGPGPFRRDGPPPHYQHHHNHHHHHPLHHHHFTTRNFTTTGTTAQCRAGRCHRPSTAIRSFPFPRSRSCALTQNREANSDFYQENRLAKFWRRLREEPLIPLGAALTCVALYRASRSIRAGNKEYTNKMFRMRIYAQAFTIAAMIAGSFYYKEQRSAQKEVAAAVAEQKAREKNAAWIRELEARDREDREVSSSWPGGLWAGALTGSRCERVKRSFPSGGSSRSGSSRSSSSRKSSRSNWNWSSSGSGSSKRRKSKRRYDRVQLVIA